MNLANRARQEFTRLVNSAKTKDAALSAFDRNHYSGKYGERNSALPSAIATLFQGIRNERFQRRAKRDIGQIASPKEYRANEIEQAIEKARLILSKPAEHRTEFIVLSLLLITGRRTAEIVGYTEFTYRYFRGTVKGGELAVGRANYLLPFMYVSRGLRELEKRKLRPLSPPEANKQLATPLKRNILRLFPFAATPHSLRSIHVAYLRYVKQSQSKIKTMTDKQRADYLGDLINNQLAHNNILSAVPYLKSRIV
jgi:hypothetical protein